MKPRQLVNDLHPSVFRPMQMGRGSAFGRMHFLMTSQLALTSQWAQQELQFVHGLVQFGMFFSEYLVGVLEPHCFQLPVAIVTSASHISDLTP